MSPIRSLTPAPHSISRASPPDAARPRLAAAKVDYLMVCPADIDMRFFADYAPDGLVADILAGDVPEWLAPVVSAGATTI